MLLPFAPPSHCPSKSQGIFSGSRKYSCEPSVLQSSKINFLDSEECYFGHGPTKMQTQFFKL